MFQLSSKRFLVAPPRSILSRRTPIASPQTRHFHPTTHAPRTKSQDLHQQLEGVMSGNNSNGDLGNANMQALRQQELQQAKRDRFRQNVINAAVTFMTVVLSAQALKSAAARRKMEAERDEAFQETRQKTMALKQVTSEETARPVARKMVDLLRQRQIILAEDATTKTKGWFAKSSSSSSSSSSSPATPSVDATALEDELTSLLLSELTLAVGHSAQFPDERDRSNLQELQQQQQADKNGIPDELNQLLAELQREQQQQQEVVQQPDGATVVKKRVFRI